MFTCVCVIKIDAESLKEFNAAFNRLLVWKWICIQINQKLCHNLDHWALQAEMPDSLVLESGLRKFAILIIFQLMLMLLAREAHCEKHWSGGVMLIICYISSFASLKNIPNYAFLLFIWSDRVLIIKNNTVNHGFLRHFFFILYWEKV